MFKGESHSQIILRDFDAPVNVGTKYVQRLISYLQVKRHFYQRYSLTEAVKVYASPQGMVSIVWLAFVSFAKTCSKFIFTASK